VALLEVVAERRHVGALAKAKVIGAVARALVVVREDDEPGRLEVEFVLLGRLVVEGLAEPLCDVALVGVELLGGDTEA
jgi:hypothetical protein